jgi:hypothetical protein
MNAKEFVDAIQKGDFRGPFKYGGSPKYRYGRAMFDADGKVVAQFKKPDLLTDFCLACSAEIRRRLRAREPYKGK